MGRASVSRCELLDCAGTPDCLNRGTCVQPVASPLPVCQCNPGFVGDYGEQWIALKPMLCGLARCLLGTIAATALTGTSSAWLRTELAPTAEEHRSRKVQELDAIRHKLVDRGGPRLVGAPWTCKACLRSRVWVSRGDRTHDN